MEREDREVMEGKAGSSGKEGSGNRWEEEERRNEVGRGGDGKRRQKRNVTCQ